jgi:DNA processing protein
MIFIFISYIYLVMNLPDELFYQIALTRTEWIGDRLARLLLSTFGSAKAIFNAPAKQLAALDNFGAQRVKSLKKEIDTQRIEEEMKFIARHQIQAIFLNDNEYPKKLKHCPDAPVLLYFKGNASLNASRVIAIVGTRNNTDYGLRCTEHFIEGLKTEDLLIVSGLAFGIDGIAHRKSLREGIPTVGVLGHGLDRIYPAQHKALARDMLENGGLLTEHVSGTKADKQNFPTRNRIAAGMSDVTVVIETDEKGGSMITAKLASGYNREVAAFPGRTIDNKSRGCNYLIRTNIAQMITSADDLLEMMNWKPDQKKPSIQKKLFLHLGKEEQRLCAILETTESMHIDELAIKSAISNAKLSSILLSLELEGLVKALPGKQFRLV